MEGHTAKRWWLTFEAVLLILAPSGVSQSPLVAAEAQSPSVVVVGDLGQSKSPVQLRATLDEDGKAEPATGHVILSSNGGEVTLEVVEVVRSEGSTLQLKPAEVKLEPPTVGEEPTRVAVTVSALDRLGRFSGRLVVGTQGTEGSAPTPLGGIAIDLTVGMTPVFQPHRGDETTLSLVDCWWASCWLADWLFPGGVLPTIGTRVENRSPGDLAVSARAWLVHDRSDTEVAFTSEPRQGIGIPALPSGANAAEGASWGMVYLPIDGVDLQPGTYEGNVVFTGFADDPAGVERQTASVVQKLTLHVRAGPLLPIFLLLIGIAVGRLALHVGSPESKLKIALYPDLAELEMEAEQIAHLPSRRVVELRLSELRRRISRAEGTKGELLKELDALRDEIESLRDVDAVEVQLAQRSLDDEKRREVPDQLQEARDLTLQGEISSASQIIDRLVDTGAPVAILGHEAPREDSLTELGRTFKARGEKKEEPEQPKIKKWAARALAFLSGTEDRFSLETLYWLWRPLLYLALIAALTVQGLLLFYTGDANQTFGSQGLTDYAPLLLWGLGTDVANRTLQQISLPGRS